MLSKHTFIFLDNYNILYHLLRFNGMVNVFNYLTNYYKN